MATGAPGWKRRFDVRSPTRNDGSNAEWKARVLNLILDLHLHDHFTDESELYDAILGTFMMPSKAVPTKFSLTLCMEQERARRREEAE